MIVKHKNSKNLFSEVDERKKEIVVFIYMSTRIDNGGMTEETFAIYDGNSIILSGKKDYEISNNSLDPNWEIRFPEPGSKEKNFALIIGDNFLLEESKLSEYMDYRYMNNENKIGKEVEDKLIQKYFPVYLESNNTNNS